MVAEGDFRAVVFGSNSIEDPAAQTGAERADIFPGRNDALNNGVRILIFNVIRHIDAFEIVLELFARELRDVLIDIDC